MMATQRLEKSCLMCGKAFSIPPCRDWREHCCSSECKVAHRAARVEALRAERTRNCQHCQAAFVVKKSQLVEGGGNFCSLPCWYAVNGMAHLNNPETQARAVSKMRALRAAGQVRYLRGEASPTWKGGKEASRERNRERVREGMKRWRAANPEKVREFSERRKGRKLGRLPRGTVKRLLELQRGKCPVCRKPLGSKYHVDHIEPLARGGKHDPANVQLLCPSCNVRKSAKDPILFMQSRGFLL